MSNHQGFGPQVLSLQFAAGRAGLGGPGGSFLAAIGCWLYGGSTGNETVPGLAFGWDERGACVNERRHAISFAVVQTVIWDENAREWSKPDPSGSKVGSFCRTLAAVCGCWSGVTAWPTRVVPAVSPPGRLGVRTTPFLGFGVTRSLDGSV